MRLLFMLALGLFIRPILVAGTEYKGVVECDDKGESFAVILPTGLDGTMKPKKLYPEFPVDFVIEKVSEVIGYVCMKHQEVVFSKVIQLPAATARIHGLEGNTFIWVASLYELSLLSKQTGKVIHTWSWMLDDVRTIAKRSGVDFDELTHVLN